MKKEDGITLIELILVVSIVGILVVAMGLSFEGWRSSYKVESQMKVIYSDLMNARVRAMARNRVHFVSLAATQYTVYEDTNPSPDGNGTLETGAGKDTQVLQKKLDTGYPIKWSAGGAQIDFSTRGLSNFSDADGVVCSNTDFSVTADYDCIVISSSRIRLGKLATTLKDGGACDSTNCVAR